MSLIKSAPAFALPGLVLMIGSVPCLASATQLLNTQDGSDLTTYSINSTRVLNKNLATLYWNAKPCYGIQPVHSGSSCYIVGFSATKEYIWVHARISAGVRSVRSVQKFAVRSALYGFYIHPKRAFVRAANCDHSLMT
jgi:hypothetical protein